MIAKKKLKLINQVTFIGEIIKEFETMSDRDFLDSPPDFWSLEERRIFDMLTEQEMKIKNEILRILGASGKTEC